MQYLNIIDILGLRDNRIARIAIGSTFDFDDIAAYAVGCILIYSIVWIEKRLQNRK